MASLLGGLLPPVTAAGTQAAGQTWIKSLFTTGIPIGWIGLFILAGGVPIAPFSFWGYGGLNLAAKGALGWAAAKGASQAASGFAATTIEAYYPRFWPYAWLLKYSPWYIFDIVQLFNPNFATEGFVIPFLNRKVGTTGEGGSLTAVVITMAIALFSFGGYSLMQWLPAGLTKTAKPIMETIFLGIGSVTALAGGGLGAYVALPQVLSAVKGNLGEISAGFSTPSGPSAASGASGASKPSVASGASAAKGGSTVLYVPPPPPPPAPSAPSAPSAPQTGGTRGTLGSQFPDLDTIAKGLLQQTSSEPAPYPAVYPAPPLKGGGLQTDDGSSSLAFLGLLGILILGGYSLALVRSKQL